MINDKKGFFIRKIYFIFAVPIFTTAIYALWNKYSEQSSINDAFHQSGLRGLLLSHYHRN